MRAINIFLALILSSSAVFAQEPIKLPNPQSASGKPLMQALKERRSSREFAAEDLPLQVISELLWAACGINRPESAGRTAPTAMNMQEIDVYIATRDGAFLFDAKNHTLIPVVSEDIREATGKQPFVKDAPVNLIYVADKAKMGKTGENADFYAGVDTGFISQNVYLYCASQGLATVVRGMFDAPALAKALKLRPDQKIILSQTVGYPK
ncbi:MAG: SagB/ThcOx family dehydrogenase [Candidatus Omnitrophica bacterium]|nr:SagB/ThcOx family dehydrogenase [Candidatus Omnitrophota bacterium]